MRSRRLPGMPVLSLDAGVAVGRIVRGVVDPDRRRVAALLVALPRWWGRRLLPIEAVHAFGGHAVTVGSADALVPLRHDEALARLLYENRIPLIGSPVVTAGGELVGTVRDYEIDRTGAITTLYVAEGMWRALSGREHAVPGSSLLALGKDAVIVTQETWEQLAQADREKSSGEKGSGRARSAHKEARGDVEDTNRARTASLIRIASHRVRARLAPGGGEPDPASAAPVSGSAGPAEEPFAREGDSPPDRR